MNGENVSTTVEAGTSGDWLEGGALVPEFNGGSEAVVERALNSENNVYREIAKDALMNWNGLSETEAAEKTVGVSLEELEGQVYAEGSIQAAINGLDKALERRLKFQGRENEGSLGEQTKTNLLNSVLNGEKSDEIFSFLGEKIKETTGGDEYWTASLVNDVLSNVHEQWTRDNKKKFFDPERAGKRYQFMPYEMIGFEEAKADLLFVEPILKAAGVEVNEQALENSYNSSQENYLRYSRRLNISNPKITAAELTERLAADIHDNPDDYFVDVDIADAVQDDKSIAEAISSQVLARDEGDGAFSRAEKEFQRQQRYLENARSITELLDPAKRDEWAEYVERSPEGIYGAMMPSYEADIIRVLDSDPNNPDMAGARKLLDEQEHSGASFYAALGDVLKMAKNGPEFARQVISGVEFVDEKVRGEWEKAIREQEENNKK